MKVCYIYVWSQPKESDMEELNLREVTKKAGLKLYEYTALLGMNHSNSSRFNDSSWERYRAQTQTNLWLLHDCPTTFIKSSLKRWTEEKPKNQEQVDLLDRIARRRLGPRWRAWRNAMRLAHPEFSIGIK